MRKQIVSFPCALALRAIVSPSYALEGPSKVIPAPRLLLMNHDNFMGTGPELPCNLYR